MSIIAKPTTLLPCGVFADVAGAAGFAAANKLPYAMGVYQNINLLQWVQPCRVIGGLSDNANFWTLQLIAIDPAAFVVVATIDTKTVNTTNWKNVVSSVNNYAFDASQYSLLYLWVTTKTGAPGNLQVGGWWIPYQ